MDLADEIAGDHDAPRSQRRSVGGTLTRRDPSDPAVSMSPPMAAPCEDLCHPDHRRETRRRKPAPDPATNETWLKHGPLDGEQGRKR